MIKGNKRNDTGILLRFGYSIIMASGLQLHTGGVGARYHSSACKNPQAFSVPVRGNK
jgi:hypothetical protein